MTSVLFVGKPNVHFSTKTLPFFACYLGLERIQYHCTKYMHCISHVYTHLFYVYQSLIWPIQKSPLIAIRKCGGKEQQSLMSIQRKFDLLNIQLPVQTMELIILFDLCKIVFSKN